MLKKTITYTDFDGNTRTEDLYFNLSKTEVIELEVSEEGGFGNLMQKIVEANDNKMILHYFKQFIKKAYGEKSEDGRRFIKSEQLSEEFTQTPAFDELIMEFFEKPDYAAEFLVSLVPKDLGDKVQAEMAKPTKPGQPQDFKKKVSLKDLQAGKS